MNPQRITKLKDQIEYCLKHNEATRNSDITLTIAVWEQFYPDSLVTARNGSKAIYLDTLFNLPREDNVKRVRAKLQNEDHLYLPTDPAVHKKRGINEDVWRGYLGYPVAGVDNQTL
jgi:hypothetical protein